LVKAQKQLTAFIV